MTKAVAKKTITPELLIQEAINKGLDVHTLERLLAMRKEIKKEYAKESYNRALAEFQKECPIIEKTKAVMNKDGKTVRYKYAGLDDIVEKTKDLISKNGFSYRIRENVGDNMMVVTCVVTHEDGGEDETGRFVLPIGTEEYMSDPQKYASRLTFAKRYAFCNAFGIMTGDEELEEAVDNSTLNKALNLIRREESKEELDGWKKKFGDSKKYSKEQKDILIKEIEKRKQEV